VDDDYGRLKALIKELQQRYGTDIVREMCGVAIGGLSKGRVALEEKIKLASRLLTMPSGANKYQLARTIAEERRLAGQKPSDPKSVERQIDDALEAARRYQQQTETLFVWGHAGLLCEEEGISFMI
jgi:hypothetical protein